MSPKQPTLGPVTFARELIDTGDLDPIYMMLEDSRRAGVLDDADIHVACFVYWLFYDLGTVARALDAQRAGQSVLDFLRANVAGTELRRGAERRHFRGERAAKALDWFANVGLEPAIIDVLEATTFKGIRDAVLKWPQFGPWIAFKAADMTERLLAREPIGDCDLSLWYDEPVNGAAMIDEALMTDPRNGYAERYRTGDRLLSVCRFLLDDPRLKQAFAPGRFPRYIRLQEVETICCKYKAHVNGHYPVGHDVIGLGKSLLAASQYSPTAKQLLSVYDRRWKAWRE